MNLRELINKKRLIITIIFSVIFSLVSIILLERLEDGTYLVEIAFNIIISLPFILTLSLSIIKRNIKIFLEGIICIVVFILIFHVIVFMWLLSLGPYIPFD